MNAKAAASRAARASAARIPIRVLTADRQPLFREAVARAVRQRTGLQLVGEVADGRAALDAIERNEPHVAVVDLHLPTLDGARVLNAVVRDRLSTRVLLIAATRESAASYDAIAAGAAGWLCRATNAGELCAAIATAASGDVVLAPGAQTAIATEIRRRAGGHEPLLDDRERRLLELAAEGWSAREIAGELRVSTGTVRATRERLYRRLGVSDCVAAVAEAIRRGWID